MLDDGWFSGRRDDTSSLGDWSVSPDLWPEGLGPLVDYVTERGMQFGLWVEPEMVNPDSDLARAHPEWLLQCGGRLPVALPAPVRARPGPRRRVRARAEEPGRAAVDLRHRATSSGTTTGTSTMPATPPTAPRGCTPTPWPSTGCSTSCASGIPGWRSSPAPAAARGSTWGSWSGPTGCGPADTIDALERQSIQRYTALLLPPELMGTHIGSPEAHTTGRQHSLTFRAITALMGPPGHRVGPDHAGPRRAGRGGSLGRPAQADARAAALAGPSSTSTTRTRRSPCTGWSPRTGGRRCSPSRR